jgi:butyrate kinase
MTALVLALNPAADATAMALFRGDEAVRVHAAPHGEELAGRRTAPRGLRFRAVREFLAQAGIARGALAAVVVRGGRLRPLEGGTYHVCDELLRDAERAGEQDPTNAGPPLASLVAAEWGCPAYVVDPESVDERDTLARVANGACASIPRVPALAMRSAAHRHARSVNRPIESLRLVVAHLGQRPSLCAQRGGRMIDVLDPWGRPSDCRNRCGAVPETALADLSPPNGEPPRMELPEALARAERGDSRAALVLQAAAYRIARGVGELATVLEGDVDAVLLTGDLAASGPIVSEVCRRVEWIAPVFLYRGEDELVAIAASALRVLSGEEPAKRYA